MQNDLFKENKINRDELTSEGAVKKKQHSQASLLGIRLTWTTQNKKYPGFYFHHTKFLQVTLTVVPLALIACRLSFHRPILSPDDGGLKQRLWLCAPPISSRESGKKEKVPPRCPTSLILQELE